MPATHDKAYSAKRVTHDSPNSFEHTRTRFEQRVGMLDPQVPIDLVLGEATWDHVEEAMREQEGPSGLICLARIDQGALLSISGERLDATLYLIGHPLVARQITSLDPAAALYAPFRVAVYADSAGVHVSYDQPSSVFASLGSDAINAIADELDDKISAVAVLACSSD